MKPSEYQISNEKFVFVKNEGRLHDKELETKPVGYFKDAFYRFKRNKASIVAFVIICLLVFYAIIGPIVSPYEVSFNDTYYKFTLPRSELFYKLNIHFWDGCTKKDFNQDRLNYYYSMGVETGHNAILNQEYKVGTKKSMTGKDVETYYVRFDTYQANGVIFLSLTEADYNRLQQYQDETGIQVIYPITDPTKRPEAKQDMGDANYWFETKLVNGKTQIVVDSKMNFTNIYQAYSGKDGYTSKVRVEGNEKLYDYGIPDQTGYNTRINYYEYFVYYHTYVLKDGITKPSFLLGTTNNGQDISTCLSSGARFSFLFAIAVASVNLLVGAIYGAIEGYYGGKLDLAMERFCDILGSVPSIVVVALLKYHMVGQSQILILFITFFATGWIGMASRTRMQFYRFKNQEYILAARTLGASDKRIMFKHIFPNALGTLVTSCVLIIPSMIFSEASLSYLNIIDLSSGNRSSVGVLLAGGQGYLATYPHIILFPSIFISLLMLSFNLFGNGLRDAFNPSLRGTED